MRENICHCFLLSCPTPSLPSFHSPFSTNILSHPYLSSFLPSSYLLPSRFSFQFTSFFSHLDLFLFIGMRESSAHCSEYPLFYHLSKLIYILNTHIHACTQRFPQISMVWSTLSSSSSPVYIIFPCHTRFTIRPSIFPSLVFSPLFLTYLLFFKQRIIYFISFHFIFLYFTLLHSILVYSTLLHSPLRERPSTM